MTTSDAVVEAFDEIIHRRNAGMFIVTVAVGAEPEVERSGCLVGFATQSSIEPRRFLLCLSEANHTTGLAARASHLGVHAAPDERFDLAERFGGQTSDDPGVDKFAPDDWQTGPHGVPLLDGCPDRFVGRILSRTPLGDHIGYLLEPVQAEVGPAKDDDDAIGYLPMDRAETIDPGHDAG